MITEMITEDYVSFETAKLLKEKGFNERTYCYYTLKGEIRESLGSAPWNNSIDETGPICAPTLQMAMKWLREVHKIAINIGWGDDEEWKKYPFDFDVHIVSEIVKQFLEKQVCEDSYAWADGSSEKGFLMKVIPETFSDEENGIKSPFYGIVSIEPYMNFYSK